VVEWERATQTMFRFFRNAMEKLVIWELFVDQGRSTLLKEILIVDKTDTNTSMIPST